jgi:endogenous inhibitor of DNA gyrase (YacG/DUF329 family)
MVFMAMIQLKCPRTGEPVDIGDLSPRVASIRRRSLALRLTRIPCPHCGDAHMWTSSDWVRGSEALADSPDAARVFVDVDDHSATALT